MSNGWPESAAAWIADMGERNRRVPYFLIMEWQKPAR